MPSLMGAAFLLKAILVAGLFAAGVWARRAHDLEAPLWVAAWMILSMAVALAQSQLHGWIMGDNAYERFQAVGMTLGEGVAILHSIGSVGGLFRTLGSIALVSIVAAEVLGLLPAGDERPAWIDRVGRLRGARRRLGIAALVALLLPLLTYPVADALLPPRETTPMFQLSEHGPWE